MWSTVKHVQQCREIKARLDQCEVLWSSLEKFGSVESILGQCG